MNENRVKLEPSWKERLGAYLERPEMQALSSFLRTEKQNGKVIYPPGPEIFAAFDHTPATVWSCSSAPPSVQSPSPAR